MKKVDYYEFLQISPNADCDTIHRVYRFLVARYHPDNTVSGDAEKFARLKTAYDILSNPARRAEYDAGSKKDMPRAAPLCTTIDFMDNMEGETNRRLALLAVLYFRRRMNPAAPEVSLAEIETRMGFPRDYLDFTTWYLQKKSYITRADNGDFTLTVEGVDFVETQRVNIPVLNKLLTAGTDSAATTSTLHPALIPDFADSEAPPVERRGKTRDRRIGLPDWRLNPTERRSRQGERRSGNSDRRAGSAVPASKEVD